MELKKIAFFVEGYTEQEFVKKLLNEVFGKKNIQIEIKEVKGGSRSTVSVTTLESPDENEEAKYYVLIYNCNGDGSIKSYILDQRTGLINAGYKKIVGLRDVYPIDRADIHKLITGLKFKVPQKEIPISFVLSVMEVEAWFLSDENHYEQIDTNLTSQHVIDNFGFNPEEYNTELIDEPAKMLHDIYQSVGKAYSKNQKSIDRTIRSLDCGNIYLAVQHRINSLNELVQEIEQMFDEN